MKINKQTNNNKTNQTEIKTSRNQAKQGAYPVGGGGAYRIWTTDSPTCGFWLSIPYI